MTSTVYSGQGVFKEGSHLAIFLSHGNKTEGGGPLLGYKQGNYQLESADQARTHARKHFHVRTTTRTRTNERRREGERAYTYARTWQKRLCACRYVQLRSPRATPNGHVTRRNSLSRHSAWPQHSPPRFPFPPFTHPRKREEKSGYSKDHPPSMYPANHVGRNEVMARRMTMLRNRRS